tara:strand:+ start:6290 stop:6838 length:549 start_codon:yes stop_codon:yes gene_type:complete
MNVKGLLEVYEKAANALKIEQTNPVLIASIKLQIIALFINGKSDKVYQMSSSKNPPSCVEGSLGTPWGLHQVNQKIGAEQPVGMVFEGREPIGLKYSECSPEMQQQNLITSRILRLEGLEEGINRGGSVDSFARYVYIHGTNHEENLGRPASSGCLQVANLDAVELFDLVPLKTHLFIHPNS